MRINFLQAPLEKKYETETLIVPVEAGKERATLTALGKRLDKESGGQLTRAIKTARFLGKEGSFLDLLAPSGLKASRILCVGIGKASKVNALVMERLGGHIAKRLGPSAPAHAVFLLEDWGAAHGDHADHAAHAAHAAYGALLQSYRFDAYRSKSKAKKKEGIQTLHLLAQDSKKAKTLFADLSPVCEGVFLARDLGNEPPNVLYPDAFAKRIRALSRLGVKVKILGEPEMKKLKMGALLGVGQGSIRESRLVSMEWKGNPKGPLNAAIVGKGVCFDTGGISLKPPGGMEAMKGDMGGAACVTGLLYALAKRKAKVNVAGVVGLVENMPGANAQRPSDIVHSMSGQTIEVLNTDAEGRLVLADALFYAQKNFKPQLMIDLATLTGAIMVALGQHYAGLFSNDDRLAENLAQAGDAVDEKLWRLPLHQSYDKMINSQIADVKNIGGGRFAGSITAAQFLQRFVQGKTPWAHLDIAGTAFDSPRTAVNPSWASGFGVRLLNRFLQDRFEKAPQKTPKKAPQRKKARA